MRNKYYLRKNLKKKRNLKIGKLKKIFCIYIKFLIFSIIFSFLDLSIYNCFFCGEVKLKILWILVVGGIKKKGVFVYFNV